MKFNSCLLISFLILLISCAPEEGDDNTDPGRTIDPIIGTWYFNYVSEGQFRFYETHTYNSNGTASFIVNRTALDNGETVSDSGTGNWENTNSSPDFNSLNQSYRVFDHNLFDFEEILFAATFSQDLQTAQTNVRGNTYTWTKQNSSQPITYEDWSPPFGQQTESFTQTRVGSDGTTQSRTIAVSVAEEIEEVFEMELNEDLNADSDIYDVIHRIAATYTTTPDIGSRIDNSVEIAHNNSGRNGITYDGELYPINFIDIIKDGASDYILSFHQFSQFYNYIPTPTNRISFFLKSGQDELLHGRYDTKYQGYEIENIQQRYNYPQSEAEYYIDGVSDTHFILNQFNVEHIDWGGAYGYAPEGNLWICNSTPLSSGSCSQNGNMDDGIEYDILNATIYYKEFNGQFFISIKGDDFERRPFQVFYYGSDHRFVSYGSAQSDVEVNSYTINNQSKPTYQLEIPYRTLTDSGEPDWGLWDPIPQNYNQIEVGNEYRLITQNLTVVEKNLWNWTLEWVNFWTTRFPLINQPDGIYSIKYRFSNRLGSDQPTIEVFYADSGNSGSLDYFKPVFLRVGTNNTNTASGFHMYITAYDWSNILLEEFRDLNNDGINEFNEVDRTMTFYLDRYLKDLANDAIILYPTE